MQTVCVSINNMILWRRIHKCLLFANLFFCSSDFVVINNFTIFAPKIHTYLSLLIKVGSINSEVKGSYAPILRYSNHTYLITR